MKRISRRVKPVRCTAAMVIGDGLLLVLSLAGVFFFQFNVYGLPGSRLVVLCACLIAAGLSLTVFSLPKYRWAVASVLIVLGLVLLWQRWDEIVMGAQAVYSTAAHVITESTDFPGEFPIPKTWSLAEIRSASNCFLTAVIFALAMPLGWAVVRRRAFLPVLLLTLSWLIPIFLAEFPPDVVALSMLAACWIVMLLVSLTARKDPEGGARLALAALPVTLLALYCICLLFPVKEYVYPNWASAAAQRLTEIGEDIWAGLGGGNVSETVDLVHAGPKRYTGKPVLKVESDWTGRLYLRGAACADYTGGSWEQLSDEALAELESMALDDSLMFRTESGQEEMSGIVIGPTYSAAITHLNGSTRMAYYLYQPVNLADTLSGVRYVADSYLCLEEPQKEYTVEFSALDNPRLLTYMTSSMDEDWSSGSDTYAQFVYDHYRDVPEELAGVLRDWVLDTIQPYMSSGIPASGLFEIDIAQLYANILEQTTQYDLQTPVTPEGEDFIAYFLTESHRGYCVHYASAAVMLLRMSGIPARYVSGYTVEITDGEALVPDSAAHAWVEVYVAGYGWYPVDVTPAAALSNSAAGEGSSNPAAVITPSAQPTAAPTPSVSPTAQPLGKPGLADKEGQGTGEPADLIWLCYAAAVLVILGLPVLVRVLRRRCWNRLTALPDNNRAVLEIYGWYHKLPSWGGKPDRQMENLARKAKFSQHTLTDEERQEALAILQREIARLSAQLSWKRPLFRYLFVWK